jgi:hypothetical protein
MQITGRMQTYSYTLVGRCSSSCGCPPPLICTHLWNWPWNFDTWEGKIFEFYLWSTWAPHHGSASGRQPQKQDGRPVSVSGRKGSGDRGASLEALNHGRMTEQRSKVETRPLALRCGSGAFLFIILVLAIAKFENQPPEPCVRAHAKITTCGP